MTLVRSPRSLIVTVSIILGTAAVACGSGGEPAGADATGTAEARAAAIARFTAEAMQTVEPASTPMPTPTPTPTVVLAGPSGSVSSDPARAEDMEAIGALAIAQSEAFSAGDIDAWYGTCDPRVRSQGRASDSLERQYKALRFEPGPEVSVELVVEQVMFTGESSANVVWGLRDSFGYYPGLGGGPYVKVDGEWFSQGWGCVG